MRQRAGRKVGRRLTIAEMNLAMGLPEGLARCAIRVSLGWASTEADVERFLAAWLPLAKRTLARTGAATTYGGI